MTNIYLLKKSERGRKNMTQIKRNWETDKFEWVCGTCEKKIEDDDYAVCWKKAIHHRKSHGLEDGSIPSNEELPTRE